MINYNPFIRFARLARDVARIKFEARTEEEIEKPKKKKVVKPKGEPKEKVAKAPKEKVEKVAKAPKENPPPDPRGMGVVGSELTPTKSQPASKEESKENYRTWAPSQRKSAEELFGEGITKEQAQAKAQEQLNQRYGGPTQDAEGKYTDEKLEGLRETSFNTASNFLEKKDAKGNYIMPDHIRSAFNLVGKKNWTSTGSARLAAHLRFNTQEDVRGIAQLIEHATNESFTPDGKNTINTVQIGKVLDKYVKSKNSNLAGFLEALDALGPAYQEQVAGIKGAMSMMGFYEEAKYSLALGDSVSGKNWYKDMTESMDKGLAHLYSNHSGYAPVSHLFGKVSNDGDWLDDQGRVAVAPSDNQQANMKIFKGLLAPTSAGQQPVSNGFSASNLLRASIVAAQRNDPHKKIEMWDVINNLQEDQSMFVNTETNYGDYLTNSASVKKYGTKEKSILAHQEKWSQNGILNPNTSKPYTVEELTDMVNKKEFIRGATRNLTNQELETTHTGWMQNSSGINSQIKFLQKFTKGDFNNIFKDHEELRPFMVTDVSSPEAQQAAVNKLADFLSHEFSHNVLDIVKNQYTQGGVNKYQFPTQDGDTQQFDKLPGSWLMGAKIGLFYQNLNYNSKWATVDLWAMRAYGRIIGSIMEDGKIKEVPNPAKDEIERGAIQKSFDAVSNVLGLETSQLQAVLWYYEQQLWRTLGNTAGSNSYEDFINKLGDSHEDGTYKPLYKTKRTDSSGINQAGQDASNVAHIQGMSNTWGESLPPFHDPKFQSQIAESTAELNGAKYVDKDKHPKTWAFIQNRDAIIKKLLLKKIGWRLKFAQFTQAPGGMTGTPVATRTNQPFSNAVAKSPGGKNLAQGALGNQINAKGGVNTTAQNAVGDWPNGSEESIVHTAPQGTDPRRLKYLGAWHGISGQKKSVLVFHPNPKGPDSLYHMVHPSTDMGEVREQLIAAGINYKTLLPGKTSTRVMVYDPNRGMRNTIDQFATNNNLNVEENIGQGEIVGHNGDWNSAGALPKSRQAYTNIIGEYEQNRNQAGPSNNTSGAPTNGTGTSTGKAQQLSRKTTAKTKIKFDRSRRVLEGFLRQHNTPNKELPPVGDLLSQDLQNIKPEHLSKYQQLIPDAKWSDIEGAVSSLQKDPSLYDDMTSESNRREMYCKEHARTVLQSSGLKKLIDSLRVQNLIPEHAQHLIEDAKDGDYFSLEAISSELQHSVPSLRAFSKAAEKEYNKAGKAWDKMRTGQPQKFAKKSAHAKDQYRAGAHGITFRGRNYNGGQFAPQNDGVKRFHKDSVVTDAIKKLRGV